MKLFTVSKFGQAHRRRRLQCVEARKSRSDRTSSRRSYWGEHFSPFGSTGKVKVNYLTSFFSSLLLIYQGCEQWLLLLLKWMESTMNSEMLLFVEFFLLLSSSVCVMLISTWFHCCWWYGAFFFSCLFVFWNLRIFWIMTCFGMFYEVVYCASLFRMNRTNSAQCSIDWYRYYMKVLLNVLFDTVVLIVCKYSTCWVIWRDSGWEFSGPYETDVDLINVMPNNTYFFFSLILSWKHHRPKQSLSSYKF